MKIELSETDRVLLDLLQEDAGRSNLALAAAAGIAPATALRRVQRLRAAGLIARTTALLDEDKLTASEGAGLSAIAEVSLDHQGAEFLQRFERRAVAEQAVQQCWRVAPGPDFVLVVRVSDMPGYRALAERLFTQDANVRNVRVFFATRRAKFDPRVTLRPARTTAGT